MRRDLSFPYRVYRPQDADGEALVLLHGSGVDETTLVPLAAEIAPRATLIAVRGRIAQDGGMRWFTRITPTRFEQQSIRSETDAFAAFIVEAAKANGLDLAAHEFLGYSNGANLISSVMLLHPGLIERAVLLRAMPVLDDVPAADLSKAAGPGDRRRRRRHLCAVRTGARGAVARAWRRGRSPHRCAGHEFGAEDAGIVRDWLAGPTARPSDDQMRSFW